MVTYRSKMLTIMGGEGFLDYLNTGAKECVPSLLSTLKGRIVGGKTRS